MKRLSCIRNETNTQRCQIGILWYEFFNWLQHIKNQMKSVSVSKMKILKMHLRFIEVILIEQIKYFSNIWNWKLFGNWSNESTIWRKQFHHLFNVSITQEIRLCIKVCIMILILSEWAVLRSIFQSLCALDSSIDNSWTFQSIDEFPSLSGVSNWWIYYHIKFNIEHMIQQSKHTLSQAARRHTFQSLLNYKFWLFSWTNHYGKWFSIYMRSLVGL